MHIRPCAAYFKTTLCDISWVWSFCGHLVCAGIFPHSPVLLCDHIGLNKTKHRNRLGISTLNSLLTVQFSVPQKCYEFKPNNELLKTCINAMNTLSHEIVVWICLAFLLPKTLDNTGKWFGNYQKNYGNTAIVVCIKDVLLRVNLRIHDARGQCYDGCSTMIGNKNGINLETEWKMSPDTLLLPLT